MPDWSVIAMWFSLGAFVFGCVGYAFGLANGRRIEAEAALDALKCANEILTGERS